MPAQGLGVLPQERERWRGEDRTLSLGLVCHQQLQASERLGSVSQRGKTSPQAYSRFLKRRDVGGAGVAFTTRVSSRGEAWQQTGMCGLDT